MGAPSNTVPTGSPGGEYEVRSYFIRGTELEQVIRHADDRSAPTAIELLLAGPTPGEVASGLRTALAPQQLTVDPDADVAPDAVVVEAGRDFASVAGTNQLLAVAQLVWTLTELPGVDRVWITIDGEPVEVPTDNGLSSQPVRRQDFMSVAPILTEGSADGAQSR